MRNASMPGRILAIKKLHTPGLRPAAEPAVLSCALPRNVGVGDTELPVSLPSYIDFPVMATKAEALQTDDIEGSVKASR